MSEPDCRTRIQRLLNYKRYIDWLIAQELTRHDVTRVGRMDTCCDADSDGTGGSVSVCGDEVVNDE
jgi:hypothetical protein